MGHTQGALATAHAQAGFLTILFAAAALLAIRWRAWAVHGALALGLGALCTTTLAYNLISRDGMAANQQRWFAFEVMIQALPQELSEYSQCGQIPASRSGAVISSSAENSRRLRSASTTMKNRLLPGP